MTNFCKGLFLLAAVSSLGLSSCSDESPWAGSDTEGGINLQFSADGRVMRQTRADDSVSPLVPEANSFAVNLSKLDGSYSKNWSSVESFNRETSFPMGDYSLTASYGDVDTEGFDNPCFKGTTDVHVSPGAETQANVVATLANAMVSIRYTDAFADNFPAYSASIQTEGHNWVVFAQNETRPAYVSPSEVKLNISLTNDAGERVTIEPASFTALARHHYVVTIDVEGNTASGSLALNVVFDDDVVAETVNVSLGDELFSAPAPTVTPQGFTPGETVSAFEYAAQKNKYEMHAFAFGGLKSATLNVVSSNGYTPVFGRTVELVNADALTQQQLISAGVDAAGFYRNVDKMGVVNLSGFISKLPAGTYDIELHVVDAMTRTSEPVKMTVALTAVDFEFATPVKAEFMASEIRVDIVTNCQDIKNQLKFKAPDAQNRMVEAPVKSVTEVSAAAGSYRFSYVLGVSPQPRSEIDVEAYLNDRVRQVKVPMADPEYSVEVDAFARKVVLKIEGADEAQTRHIRNNLTFYNGADAIPTANVSHSADGLVTIIGLQPSSTYSSLQCVYGKSRKQVPEFTTEAETALTNGNFTSTAETLNFSNIQVGGKYKAGAFDYYNRSSIVRSEANGWASVNALTCSASANTKNTWFMVPSTYAENGEVVIRSVGYHHNGVEPAKSGSFFNTNYYCENAPADNQLMKASGELFLGSYGATRVDGINFPTRPSSLSFRYRYAPVNGELAEAYVKVLDASGTVIAQGSSKLVAAASMQSVSVPLTGYAFGKKASKIMVCFRSTESGVTPKVNIPSGSALKENDVHLNTDYYWTLGANDYHALAVGSVLTVDDVTLGYEATVTPAKSKRRNAKR